MVFLGFLSVGHSETYDQLDSMAYGSVMSEIPAFVKVQYKCFK